MPPKKKGSKKAKPRAPLKNYSLSEIARSANIEKTPTFTPGVDTPISLPTLPSISHPSDVSITMPSKMPPSHKPRKYDLEEPDELKKLLRKKEEYLGSKIDALNSAIQSSSIGVFEPDCIRKRSNFVKRFKYDAYNLVDNPIAFDLVKPADFLANLKYTSPKLEQLLDKIKTLDAKDLRESGKRFKHFIFCDVKNGSFGAKMIASGLIASGMTMANTADKRSELLKQAEAARKAAKAEEAKRKAAASKKGDDTPPPKKKGVGKGLGAMYNTPESNSNSVSIDSKTLKRMQADQDGITYSSSEDESTSDSESDDDDEDREFDEQSGGAKKKVLLYNKMYILPDAELKKTRGNNFFLLNSTALFERPIPVATKKQILAKFNERPDNIYGANARIIVMDSGYKEGIDLFDIKYIHIFEPSVTLADQKQVIGRGTRTCGQRGLKFHPTKGWPLHVFVYDMEIPERLSPSLKDSKTAFELYMKALNLDARLYTFSEELENETIYGSVDYELNKNIHSFSLGSASSSASPIRGGGSVECGKGTKKRCPKGNRCNNTLKKCMPNGAAIPKKAAAAAAAKPQPQPDYPKAVPKRDSAGNVMRGPHGTALMEQTPSGSPIPPQIQAAVAAIASPPAETMGHKEMREYINANYSQYKWDKLKMENLCGAVPDSPNASDEAREGALAAVKEFENNRSEMSGGGAAATEILKYSPSQDFVRNYFTSSSPLKGMLLWNSVGTGKCHAKDTPIIMHDGTVKMVQDIVVGDKLMGDDSKPREVLSLARGEDEMYDIIPVKGEKYTVNSVHILVLKKENSDEIIEIEVKDYLKLPKDKRDELKGFRCGVEFEPKHIDIDPYVIGQELKDNIPELYKYNDRNIRLNVLAGLLDTNGRYKDDCFEINHINDALTKDILYLVRSLGFAAYVENNIITISGLGLENIPTAEKYEFSNKTDELTTGITVKSVGMGDYYGFTIDGNNRYLLGDFTVTHNTCAAIAAATHTFERDGYTILWVTRTTLKNDIWKNMFQQVCHEVIREKIAAGLEIPERQDARMKLLSKAWKIRPMSYKQFSNLVSKENKFYDDLVKINGSADPLRKTLLIIDEAHKLYGGGDLSSIERPDMNALSAAVNKSYEISGRDSVKLLLMTATPITNDPMELVKLVNLFKPIGQKMPDSFDDFSAMYLDEDGKFTVKGRAKYLDDIAGHVSYLNREKDARQFSQPRIERVYTPIADVDDIITNDRSMRAKIYKDALQSMRDEVKRTTEAVKKEFGKVTQTRFLKELYKGCAAADFDTKEKKLCEKIARQHKNSLVGEIEDEMEVMKARIKELREQIKAMLLEKKERADKMKANGASEEIYKSLSLYRELRRKCNKKISSEKEVAQLMKKNKFFDQINEKIKLENEKIKAAIGELKTYMTAYNLKMKELQRTLKTGDFTANEKQVIRMTIKHNRTQHKTNLKELKQDIKGKINYHKTNIKYHNKTKKDELFWLKKDIKSKLTTYKRQNMSLKRISKKMLGNIKKKMEENGIDAEEMSDKVKEIVERHKKKLIETVKTELGDQAAAKERKAAEKAAEKERKAAAAAAKTKRTAASKKGGGRHTRRRYENIKV